MKICIIISTNEPETVFNVLRLARFVSTDPGCGSRCKFLIADIKYGPQAKDN